MFGARLDCVLIGVQVTGGTWRAEPLESLIEAPVRACKVTYGCAFPSNFLTHIFAFVQNSLNRNKIILHKNHAKQISNEKSFQLTYYYLHDYFSTVWLNGFRQCT